jgi:mannose-1-phosphate guanylyltransferase
MKILIFAGGVGTRLWPLSRKKHPKQFKEMFNGNSTLQLAVERVERSFGTHNIYISTNEDYISLAKSQLPQIPNSNIIGEPEKRDLAAAVGYNFIRLRKLGYKGPVAILWADHLMERPSSLVDVLKEGEDLILEDPKRLVFVGEKPRYPENNLGWIHLGKKIKGNVYEFVEWKYRPDYEKCVEMFETGKWKWNPGYFIVDLEFILELYEKYAPTIYEGLVKIEKAIGTVDEADVLSKIYPTLESIHFDEAILEKVPANQAVVVETDMGWSDPGTLYALKEATIGKSTENMIVGLAKAHKTTDSLIINEDADKLVTVVGLNGAVVINTSDAMIVTTKENVREVTGLLNELKEDKNLERFI